MASTRTCTESLSKELHRLCSQVGLEEESGKGRKLVALSSITAGQLLWTEHALVWAEKQVSAAVSSFLQSASPSPTTASSLLASMHWHREGGEGQGLPLHHLWQLHPVRGRDMQQEDSAVIAGLYDVFRYNGILLSNGSPTGAVAIFLATSMLNHSCTPNVRWQVQGTILQLYACRDIAPGEELCVNYLGSRSHGMDVEGRQAKLRASWGFTCTCPACTTSRGVEA